MAALWALLKVAMTVVSMVVLTVELMVLSMAERKAALWVE